MRRSVFIIVAGTLFLSSIFAGADSIVNSKHDLGVTGSGVYTAEVCVACHTPHGADTAAPLWNRNTPDPNSFTMYNSATMDTSHPGRPNDLSLVCLGCHDGAVSDSTKHTLINPPNTGGQAISCDGCHMYIWVDPPGVLDIVPRPGLEIVGTDLSSDHPISINYPAPAEDPDFRTPPDLQKGWTDVKLYSGNVECPSCHDVHDPGTEPFLRISNNGSVLCYKCHVK